MSADAPAPAAPDATPADARSLSAPADVRSLSAAADDRFTTRARPAFLYVMYALLLGAWPMAIVAAFRSGSAAAMTRAVAAYLGAIPEPLYALFGTGYLGYTVMREWGKARR